MMSIEEQDEMNRRKRLQRQQEMAAITRNMTASAKAREVKSQLLTPREGGEGVSADDPNADVIAEHGYGGTSVGGDATPPANPGQGMVLEKPVKQPKMAMPEGVDPSMLEELLRRMKGG